MKKIILLTILFGNCCLIQAEDQVNKAEKIKEQLKGKCDIESITLEQNKLQADCYSKDGRTFSTEIDIYNENINLDVDETGDLFIAK